MLKDSKRIPVFNLNALLAKMDVDLLKAWLLAQPYAGTPDALQAREEVLQAIEFHAEASIPDGIKDVSEEASEKVIRSLLRDSRTREVT